MYAWMALRCAWAVSVQWTFIRASRNLPGPRSHPWSDPLCYRPARVQSPHGHDHSSSSFVRLVQDPAPEAVDRALGLLARARRPLIVLGKGAAYAQADAAIRAFVETTGIPFLPMSMAKGLLPDDHPQSVAAARSLATGPAQTWSCWSAPG